MRYVFSFFALLIVLPCRGYYDYSARLETAYNHIISLNLDKAASLLNEERVSRPGNDLVHLYENYIDFLKAFITEEKSLFEKLKVNASKRLSHISAGKGNESSPFHLYTQAQIHIHQALVRIKFEENILSAGEIRKAYRLIEKNRKLFPSFVLNTKTSGFLHAVIGAVPEKYQWLVSLAGMTGTVDGGLKELEAAYRLCAEGAYRSYRREILFYLGTIYSVFAMTAADVPLLATMDSLSQGTPLIAYVYSNIMMKKGMNEKALAALNSSLHERGKFPFVFLYYKRGLCRLRQLDLSSETDFKFFLNNYRGTNNIKAAYQKLAWISLLNADTAGYRKTMRECLTKGSALLDEDRDAHFEAATGEMPNTFLLRSRLYFDGGYYTKARAEIASHAVSDFPRHRDKLEITYRLGRILQMTGDVTRAIQYYETTIRNGRSSRYHFAANSALMLGLICEEKKDYAKALKYFRDCLSMDYDQYKNSIDQRAKAAIDRIENLNTK